MYFLRGILILTEQKIYGEIMINKMKGMVKAAFYTGLSSILLLPTHVLAAQNLADSMKGLSDASEAGTKLIFIVSALVGIALMIAGGLQLKKYADNPQQNGIAKPMIYLLAGVLVFGVVATSQTMEETLFGGSDTKKAVELDTL